MSDGDIPSLRPSSEEGAVNKTTSIEAIETDDAAQSNAAENPDSDLKEKPSRSVFSRIKQMLGAPPRDDALARALQNGDSIVAGLSVERRDMIERVLEFDTMAVEDVMIPRADIVAVDSKTSVLDLLKIFSGAGHSRLPVFRGDLDDPMGMIHIKDLVGILADPKEAENKRNPLSEIVRKILYVPPSMPITDLLLKMQASRIHMALVIDEFGGTDGLVTIEDLIEQIVGEIRDEHDDEDDPILRLQGAGVWSASARVPLEDLEEATGSLLGVDEDDVDTLGGLVFTLAGHIPARGEIIRHPSGIEFEVTDADPRRIRKLIVRILPKD